MDDLLSVYIKKKKKILYFFSAFPCGPLNFSLHGLNTGLQFAISSCNISLIYSIKAPM